MYRVNLIYAPLAQLVEQLTLNQWVLGSSPRWCTKVRVARNCSAFFIAIFQRRFNLVHHRVTRTARARRRSGGQKRPSGAFLERGRVPDGAAKNALHESVRRFFIALFQEGTIWCTVRDTRTGRRHAVP